MARSNQKVVPEAKEALDKFKYEVASDMCVKNIFTLISSSYFLKFIFYSFTTGRPEVRPPTNLMQFVFYNFSFHLIH